MQSAAEPRVTEIAENGLPIFIFSYFDPMTETWKTLPTVSEQTWAEIIPLLVVVVVERVKAKYPGGRGIGKRDPRAHYAASFLRDAFDGFARQGIGHP